MVGRNPRGRPTRASACGPGGPPHQRVRYNVFNPPLLSTHAPFRSRLGLANLFQILLQIRMQLQLNGGIVQIVAIDQPRRQVCNFRHRLTLQMFHRG